jgi:hypothetical protein
MSGLVVCLPLIAAVLLTPGGAASPQTAVASKRVILRPNAHQRVRRHPVRLVVRGGDGLFDVRARLNGRKITDAFGRARKGKRVAWISSSHGLKRGRNVLRVKARRRVGKRRRKARVAFFVRHARPLAGAGRDRRIVEGETFRLRGQALPRPRKSRARANRRIKYRWRITKAPRRSAFRDDVKAGSARRAGGPLRNPTARRPGFTPDVPGQYRFKLRAVEAGRSSSDEVRLNAVPDTPFVPIETMLHIPSPAIGVGGKVYPAGERSSGGPGNVIEDAFLQVLVLDRDTLGLVSNKTYGCPFPHNCAAPVVEDLKKLDDKKLVIAVNHPGFFMGGALPVALAPIGFPTTYDPVSFINAPSGTVSAIGVPGLPAGQADISIDLDGPPGIASMDGYLTPNQHFDYTWLPKDRLQYDTRESQWLADDSFGNVMEIDGTKIESESVGGDGGAFQVVVRNGLNGKLVDNQTYVTHCTGDAQCSTTHVDEMSERLRQVTEGQVAFITSIVVEPFVEPVDPDATPAAWNKLASEIARLGGSRNAFFEATAKKGASYTLVGWGDAGEGNGEESTSVKDTQAGAGRLQGTLVPGHTSQPRPAVASVGDAPNEALMQLTLKPEGPWPLDDNAEAQSAIRWIGSQIKQLGKSNPRSAYWIQDFHDSKWMGIANQVDRLEYPGRLLSHGFSKKNFLLAQNELVKEINWVGDVRDYLADLSAPFSDEALPSWAKLTTISDKVDNALNPPNNQTEADVLDVVRGFLGVAGAAGGPPTEAVAEVFQAAIDILAEQQNGSDISKINVRASELAGELIDRLKSAEQATQRIGDIIVADYTKLSTVATNERCSPKDPNCPVEWQFTTKDQQSAAASIYKGIETLFDEQFMGIAFPAYRLAESSKHHNAREWVCTSGGGAPFDNQNERQHLPDNGQSELIIGKPAKFQVYALGSKFPKRDPMDLKVPPAETLDRMFSPASSSLDPTQGGLGIYRPDFMLHANPRDFPPEAVTTFCHFPGG